MLDQKLLNQGLHHVKPCALLYIDLRIRREGLDVELARAAEAVAEQPTAP